MPPAASTLRFALPSWAISTSGPRRCPTASRQTAAAVCSTQARPSLQGDLVVGNFEGVLADTGTSVKCLVKPAPGHDSKQEAQASRRPPGRSSDSAQLLCLPYPRRCWLPGWSRPVSPTSIWPTITPTISARLAANRPSACSIAWGFSSTGPGADSDGYTSVGATASPPSAWSASPPILSPTICSISSGARRWWTRCDRMVDLLIVTFHGGAEGVKALRTAEAAESLGAEPGEISALGSGGDRCRCRCRDRPRAPRLARHGVLSRPADGVLAGQFSDLPRLQPGRAIGHDGSAAAGVRRRSYPSPSPAGSDAAAPGEPGRRRDPGGALSGWFARCRPKISDQRRTDHRHKARSSRRSTAGKQCSALPHRQTSSTDSR